MDVVIANFLVLFHVSELGFWCHRIRFNYRVLLVCPSCPEMIRSIFTFTEKKQQQYFLFRERRVGGLGNLVIHTEPLFSTRYVL